MFEFIEKQINFAEEDIRRAELNKTGANVHSVINIINAIHGHIVLYRRGQIARRGKNGKTIIRSYTKSEVAETAYRIQRLRYELSLILSGKNTREATELAKKWPLDF